MTALSCSAADVQSALDQAADGASVVIPAGTCDWGTASVSRAAGVWLRGAGKDVTIVRRTGSTTDFMVTLDCSNGLAAHVSGITFVGKGDTSVDDNGLSLDHGCVDFKVHDCRFTRFSESGLEVRGASRGVVYHSDFVSNFKVGLGYGVVVYGAGNWPPLTLGTEDAVFVEDNRFYENRHAIASNYGSRYVFRHNVAVTTSLTRNWGIVDAHGKTEFGPGSRSWEVYDNLLQTDMTGGETTSDGIYFRGGDGVVFGNTIDVKVAYTTKITAEGGCAMAGSYPIDNQTRAAWIWGNTWGSNPAFVRVDPPCDTYFVEGRDYFEFAKPGYTPYAYPHPLRQGDPGTLFVNGFESLGVAGWSSAAP